MSQESELLARCAFPAPGSAVDLAVSGGPDSMGMLLLAIGHGLDVSVHHVDHHARTQSADDAAFVRAFATARELRCYVHDVDVALGANFEARARAERRRVLPVGALTGHTMDDLAETVLLNMMRGAGLDGLSPMLATATKPVLGLRRQELHEYVRASGVTPVIDATNEDPLYLRNRVRQDLVPGMSQMAGRDIVPILARQAALIYEERRWLEEMVSVDEGIALGGIDCAELRGWEPPRLRRWLRYHLRARDDLGESHPPSTAEIERAIEVIHNRSRATQLSAERRLSRSAGRLSLEEDSTTLT